MDISGKVVLITGASQGIGRATALLLGGQGAKLVLAARSDTPLRELAAELPDAHPVPTDMRSSADVDLLVAEAVDHYGRVDILINNAGKGMYVAVEGIDLDQYQDLLELNLLGYLRAMQAVIPIMRRQGGGMIVNVSSMVTRNHFPRLAGYASTKYAVNALTLAARQELAEDNIVVSLIRPKLVETDFGRNSLVAEPDAIRDRGNPHAPPMDTPEFVAEKIAELIASEAAELDLAWETPQG